MRVSAWGRAATLVGRAGCLCPGPRAWPAAVLWSEVRLSSRLLLKVRAAHSQREERQRPPFLPERRVGLKPPGGIQA